MVRALRGRWRVYALTHSENRHALLRAEGILPVAGDLDRPETLDRLPGLAQDVVHFAPPPGVGTRDTRTANLIRAFAKGGSLPQRMVYISTSGVYGDCGGALVEETRQAKPSSDRARRRLDAERQLRAWGVEMAVHVSILRVPGIYAAERLPLARLRAGTPALATEQDPYTNHIHADDLAAIALKALDERSPAGIYNASDDTHLKMGAWFDRRQRSAVARREPIEIDPGRAVSHFHKSQRQAELMAGRRAISEHVAEIPAGLNEVVIGDATAREIRWAP